MKGHTQTLYQTIQGKGKKKKKLPVSAKKQESLRELQTLFSLAKRARLTLKDRFLKREMKVKQSLPKPIEIRITNVILTRFF